MAEYIITSCEKTIYRLLNRRYALWLRIIYSDAQNKLRTGGKAVKSENTDGYSVAYVDLPAGMTDEQALHQKCYGKIRLYLQDTTLLYPGVYYDYEC